METAILHPVHPLAEAFPLIEGPAFDELVASIRENGLREPVVLYEGAVLDGRNRLRACEAAKVDPRFEDYTGNNPAAFVIDKNINRRHLNESQRAMVAAKLATIPRGVHKKAKDPDIEISISPLSVPEAAALLNVNEATVSSARTVLARGTPDEVRQVESGEAAVTTVARQIRQGVDPESRTPRKKPDLTKRNGTQQLNAQLWHQFKDAINALVGMPHVEDAVRIIRAHDKAKSVPEQLPIALQWMKDFHDAWNHGRG